MNAVDGAVADQEAAARRAGGGEVLGETASAARYELDGLQAERVLVCRWQRGGEAEEATVGPAQLAWGGRHGLPILNDGTCSWAGREPTLRHGLAVAVCAYNFIESPQPEI